jgi:tryptophan-rich sensory protein
LGVNLAIFVLLPVALNGVIFGLGWDKPRGPEPGLPPGWVVGALWVLLFAAMGVARWLLLRVDRVRAELVSGLGFLCLLYPLYTAGLSDMRVGLWGNVITAIVALVVAVLAFRRNRAAGLCLSAVCVWLLYAAGVTAAAVLR